MSSFKNLRGSEFIVKKQSLWFLLAILVSILIINISVQESKSTYQITFKYYGEINGYSIPAKNIQEYIKIVGDYGGEITSTSNTHPILLAKLSQSEADRIAKNPNVESVVPVVPV
jgi:hypothetical protein